MKFRHRKCISKLFPVKSQNTPHTRCGTKCAISPGTVKILIMILKCQTAPDRCLIAHNQRCQIFFPRHSSIQGRCQNATHKRGPRMSLNHVMTIINIKRIGRMGHSNCSSQNIKPALIAYNRNLSILIMRLRHRKSRLKLFSLASNQKRHHQIDSAYNCPLLHLFRQVLPASL